MALDNIGEAGQIKRKIYQRRLPENPNQDYYYILRETGNTEPILVEYGFIDNVNDANKLKNNLNNYVEGVVKAIAEYSGYNYYPPNTDQNSYIVKAGDTLYKISNLYNVPVEEIKRINNLTNNTLKIGQILYLKSPLSQSTIKYIVKAGDTLYKIALEYDTTVEEIKKINKLNSNTLSINQELIIPQKENIPPENNEIETSIYTVQKGDSLWSIAQKYNLTVDDLIELNNLKKLTLQIGQQLLIPKVVNNLPNNIYTVQKGDTLWSIAKTNNLTVNELKELNNLITNSLSIGQQLIISK